MSINHILTPDEYEFFDYMKNDHLSYFKDFINIKDYHIDFVAMYADSREFIMGFSKKNQFMHELSDVLLTFKVSHNHGNFLVYDIKTNNINHFDLDRDDFFIIEKSFEYESEII